MARINEETAQQTQTPAPASTSPATVQAFNSGIAPLWDRFVQGQPGGSFFQLTGWKRVLEKTFGYEACYFYAQRDGEITGVAPYFRISNWIVGRCLLSVPLGVYGGVCAADAESEQALMSHLRRLAVAEQVEYLESRDRAGTLRPDFHANTRYVTFTCPLTPDHEANLKRLPKDTRYMIRRSQKSGLQARQGLEQLDQFYDLYAMSMRRLGTPVFPRDLFTNFVAEFPDKTHLFMVYAGDKPVTGVFSFFFRDTILPFYAGAGPEAPGLSTNNFMYAELMKFAAQAGFRCFDFGRSKKNTGSFAFKAQWNMEIEPLNYQVYLVRRKSVPNFSPVNPKFELATRVWKRMPLPLVRWIGPRVVRWFP